MWKMWKITWRKKRLERYAAAVLDILRPEFEFTAYDAELIHDRVRHHALTHGATLEVIVDSPTFAYWRLRTHRNKPGRVRIACYRLPINEADREREDRINQQLEAVQI